MGVSVFIYVYVSDKSHNVILGNTKWFCFVLCVGVCVLFVFFLFSGCRV